MQRGHRISRTAFIVGSASALTACSPAPPALVGNQVGMDRTSDALRGRWKILATGSGTLLSIQFTTGGRERTHTQLLISGKSAARSPSGRPMTKPASVRFVPTEATELRPYS
jgi:hypothetical protein